MYKKAFFNLVALCSLGTLLMVIGCQDPISVGGELLENERIEVLLKDYNNFNSTTLLNDSIVTKSANRNNTSIILGAIKDDIFGQSAANAIITLRRSNFPDSLLDGNIRIDSLVLIFEYGTNLYGSTKANQTLKVYDLNQHIVSADSFYSNSVISTKSLLADDKKSINTQDSLEIINHANGDTIKVKSQLRIRLNDDLGRDLISDRNTLKSDTNLTRVLKGLMVKAEIDNLEDSKTYELALATSRLSLFISKDDTTKYTINLLPNIAFNTFTHTRDNAAVNTFVGNQLLGDSLVFLHGGGYLTTRIQFNDLDSLEDLSINLVELQITANENILNKDIFPNIPRIWALRKDEDGRRVLIEDMGVGGALVDVFDGRIRRIQDSNVYKLNITNHLKRSIRDKNYNSDIYLVVETESFNMRKSVLYGAKHSLYPMKIKITHTKNQ